MNEPIIKSVYQIVGNGICVEASEGEKVYSIIYDFIKEKHPINLSFLNVTMITASFLNNAIGKLYKDFTEKEIKDNLEISNMDDTDVRLLKKVVEFAKEYYKNPEHLENSIREVLGE